MTDLGYEPFLFLLYTLLLRYKLRHSGMRTSQLGDVFTHVHSGIPVAGTLKASYALSLVAGAA